MNTLIIKRDSLKKEIREKSREIKILEKTLNLGKDKDLREKLSYLKGRIEERMAMMKLAGSEVHLEFSDTFKEMAYDKTFEDKMNEKMLLQMQTSWDEIEQHESGLGFDDLSLESFRQDLFEELQENENFYKNMPNGVYTGFTKDDSVCTDVGIIALLGFPSRSPKSIDYAYQNYDLIYIDMNGEQVLLNQKEVLEALAQHKDCSRYIPDAVERGEENAINELASALKIWLKKQAEEEELQADGTVKKRAGAEMKDILEKLKKGDKSAIQRMKKNIKVSDKYQTKNFDLITWFLVN
jgi:hypothetical protein